MMTENNKKNNNKTTKGVKKPQKVDTAKKRKE